MAHAKPGAQIALGLKPEVTRAQFEQAIHQERAEELLNWMNVFAGEMILRCWRTVHTLRSGLGHEWRPSGRSDTTIVYTTIAVRANCI